MNNIEEVEEIFEKYEDEYIAFDKVEIKLSQRPDLHAYILLDKLFPKTCDIVCGAGHDEIYLDCDEDEIVSLSEDQLLQLIRCGVRLQDNYFVMFV